jgi:glycosyltransferase involved in cell wall biosynthesis
MRIAVYSPAHDAQLGGAATFESTVLRGIAQIAPDSAHDLVIVTSAPEYVGSLGMPPSVKIAPLVRSKVTRARDRLATSVRKTHAALTGRPATHVVRDFEELLARERIDAVWFLTPLYLPTDLPFVYTVWDLQHLVQPWFPEVGAAEEWEGRRCFYDSVVRRALRVIVSNEAMEKDLVRSFHLERARVLRLRHPTSDFALSPPSGPTPEVVRARLGLAAPYLFYPAQFWPHKNHVTLIEALRLLALAGDRDLVLAFSGSDQGNLAHVRASVERAGLADRVRFLGFVERADLVALYRGAEMLVFASCFGPENLPPLEAFCFDCPVVSADYVGSDEQLGDAAVRVPAFSAEAFAAAIQRVRSDGVLRAGLIAAGRVRASSFTGADYARGVVDAFDAFAAIRRLWPSAGGG